MNMRMHMISSLKMKNEKNMPLIRICEIKEEWLYRELKEVKDVRDGTHSSPKYIDNGYPLVTSKNLTDSGLNLNDVSLISESDYNEINKRSKVEVGDILLGLIGTIGKPVLVETEGFAIKNVGLIKNGGQIQNQFLLQYLKTNLFNKYIQIEMAGNTQKFLGLETLRNTKVPVPSSDEQSAIGTLFRTLDDLLASYKDNLANYQSLKATMLSKMFPKAGHTIPEIRLDVFEDEWEEKEFSKLVKRVTQSSDSDSLPKVEFEDIISGQGQLNKDISSKFDNRKGIHFKPGYTLYGKLRPYLNNWLLPKFEGVALGDFWVFDPNGNDSNFIYYLVQSNRYQKVANDTSGTKMPRSDWKSVSSTIFAIPQTITEQQAIGAYFSNLDNLINSHQEKITQLETLKKKLLQDMFI